MMWSITFVLYVVSLAQGWQMPAALEARLNEFAVTEVFRDKPATVVFTRAEERHFRTMIRLG